MNRYSLLTVIFLLSPINLYAQSFYKIGLSNTLTDQNTNYSGFANAIAINNTSQSSSSDGPSLEVGIGTKFKHKSGIFVAPIISFEKFDELKHTDSFSISYTYKDRIKTYANLGFEKNKFSIFTSLGVANTSYEANFSTPNSAFYTSLIGAIQPTIDLGTKSGRESSFIYGLGFAYKLSNNIEFLMEHKKQNISFATTHLFNIAGVTNQSSRTRIESTTINIINYF